ncbi:MAG TPA: hypothetical protein ENF77_00020 [Candidatus Acetothermia bacterium]|nr:hypothetical protein [Candidatus Bipolaricaulota bacterium]HDI10701.1 hypothetical protein [Candidatus Acetothermia bacterium]
MWERIKEILEIKARHLEGLLRKATVRGVGIGYKVVGGEVTDELSLVVLVTRKLKPLEDIPPSHRIPREIEGVRTDVIDVGVVRVSPPEPTALRRDRLRPAPGGCSIGHVRVTAGTMGCLVRRGKERFILSNNHVLAATNLGAKGDYILQPGPADGGRVPEDGIAELAEYVPLDFSGVNQVDAAIARPFSQELVVDEILDIGVPLGAGDPELQQEVLKSGRTTGLTRGHVGVVEATIDVLYGERKVRFEGQCVIPVPGFSRGGDSGSAIISTDRKIVGLLFAGSEEATVFTPIRRVLQALKVEL